MQLELSQNIEYPVRNSPWSVGDLVTCWVVWKCLKTFFGTSRRNIGRYQIHMICFHIEYNTARRMQLE